MSSNIQYGNTISHLNSGLLSVQEKVNNLATEQRKTADLITLVHQELAAFKENHTKKLDELLFHIQGVPQNMSDFVFLHFSQQSNIKKQNLMVPSNFLLNSMHENVQKLIPSRKNNQFISIFLRDIKKPKITSHPPLKPCLGKTGTIHLFSQLK